MAFFLMRQSRVVLVRSPGGLRAFSADKGTLFFKSNHCYPPLFAFVLDSAKNIFLLFADFCENI